MKYHARTVVADASKFFDAAQALSQNLSQWALLIIGGSLVVVVSNDYYRPPSRRMRYPYLLFVPAWGLLASSIYFGIQAQGAYVGYLLVTDPNRLTPYKIEMNDLTAKQISTLEWALVFIGVWLVFYIFWWVFSKPAKEAK